MATSVGGTTSAQWSDILINLRRYITRDTIHKRFQEEFFAFDILKVLCEKVDTLLKVELLVILEQYGNSGQDSSMYDPHSGQDSASNLEQILGSLLGIFSQTQTDGDCGPFACQILVTITSLLIQALEQISLVQRSSVVLALVDVISAINDVESRRLRACACQCLIEVETWLPGMLQKRLELLITYAKQERTDVAQDYTQLLAIVMHNSMSRDPVVNSTEDNDSSISPIDSPLSPIIDVREMRQTVLYIMDNTAIFTPPALWSVIRHLVKVVRHTPELSPLIFKPLVLQHLPTVNLNILHLIIYLKREFSIMLFTPGEESLLLQRMIVTLNHPSLRPGHRHIVHQWLLYYCSDDNDCEARLPDQVRKNNINEFLPSVFDNMDTQLVKLCILSHCYIPNENTETAHAVFLGSLNSLHKLVRTTGSFRAGVTVFQAVFEFYRRHHDISFNKDIKQFILSLVSEFPHFIPNTLNFLDCVKLETPKSPLYLELLVALHDQILASPTEQITSHLAFFLHALRVMVMDKDIRPKRCIKFMLNLLENIPQFHAGNWILGNNILTICRNILLHHSTDFIYKEMGGLLFYLMAHYDEIDIQDRARFYYALLTSAADKKIRDVLRITKFEAGTASETFSNLMPDGRDNLGKTRLIYLTSPILTWERLSVQPVWKSECIQAWQQIFMEASVKEDGLHAAVKAYLMSLLEERPVSLLATYRASMDRSSEFDTFLALTISVESDDNVMPIKDTHIASFTKSDTNNVQITFQPGRPVPANLKTWATFASSDGTTYTSQLQSSVMQFQDLLLPLPWSCLPLLNKLALFKSLWCCLLDESISEITSLQSVYILHVEKPDLPSKVQHLSQFRIEVSDTNADVDLLNLGIFLPPRYHLLMKMESFDHHTVISIATDSRIILPYLQAFLDSLNEECS